MGLGFLGPGCKGGWAPGFLSLGAGESRHSWVLGKDGAEHPQSPVGLGERRGPRVRIPELMGEIGRMGLLCLREEGAGGAVSWALDGAGYEVLDSGPVRMEVGTETHEEVVIGGLNNVIPEGAGLGVGTPDCPSGWGCHLSIHPWRGGRLSSRIPHRRELGIQPLEKGGAGATLLGFSQGAGPQNPQGQRPGRGESERGREEAEG